MKSMKLFAAIFLDGELNGSPLEGLDHASVAHELIDYFKTSQEQNRTHIISRETIDLLIKHLECFENIAKRCDIAGVSGEIDQIKTIAADILKQLGSSKDIFFPGGWYAEPTGHAMVYRLFYDKTDNLVFLAYNTGEGTQYHKKIDCGEAATFDVETYREKFNPVYAIRFDDPKKLAQLGALQAWIEKLLEPHILPRYPVNYQDNDARSIYKKILPLSTYLNGKVVDPDEYFPWATAGQKSGTCAQYSIQQAVRTFLQSDVQYEQYILDYRLHVLEQFIVLRKLPKYFENHYHQAIMYTTRMITTKRPLEKELTQEAKQTLLDKLDSIKKKAQTYFNRLPETPKPETFIPKIKPEQISIPASEWAPHVIEARTALQSDLVPCQSLLLFNPKSTLSEAVFCLQRALEHVDRRLFIYNLEQLCFIFCEKIKDFKAKSLEASQNDIETWARVIQLLHQYSFEYFDFYFKDHDQGSSSHERKRYAAWWFKEERLKQNCIEDDDDDDDDERSTIKPSRASEKAASSPRNQMMGLALMTLQHYATMHYHGALLDQKDNWQATLSYLDVYTAYMQHWMIREKMQRDFFLSSTDPNLSHLFQSLNAYYSGYHHDVEQLRQSGPTLMGQVLIKHYIQLMQTTYFKEEKEALEALFQEHILLIRSNCYLTSDSEHVLCQHALTALFMYNNNWRFQGNKDIIWPKTPKLKQLMRIHYHTELTIVLGTNALLYGSNAPLSKTGFSIHIDHNKVWAATALTGNRPNYDLLWTCYHDTKAKSIWRDAHWNILKYGIERITQSSDTQSRFDCNPLFHDVMEKPYTSNEICLLREGVQSKIQRHLRTALPLQALQLLDYFTQHIHLLEQRDDQFYLLFSLFQPGVIDQGLAHNADLLLAIKTLYQKGIVLGDLSCNAPLLSYRGLFLIKLTSWVLGYVLTAHPDKEAYRAYYETIDEDVRYWMAHTQPEPIQTELHRVLFYNTMRLYTPETLSLPEHRALLIDCLFSYFTLKEHIQDRVPGTITKTEDESFEPLILNLLLLKPEAVQDALQKVLGKLLKDQSPLKVTITEPELKGIYTYLDGRQQKIDVHLLDGQIIVGENNLTHIPTFLRQHRAYQTAIDSEYDPLAIRLNETTYKFEWRGNSYCLSDQKLFKKINDVWYQYQDNYCLPPALQKNGQFVWAGEGGKDAFIMQINEANEAKQVGEFKKNQLYLQQPKGLFCLDGDVRIQILEAFHAFEKPSMIAVVQLDNQPDIHQFELPYYQLSGHFSSKTGIVIRHDQRDYAVISKETPFDTGIWLGYRPDAIKVERLYLVPIRPFYKEESHPQETMNDVYYHLTHDVQRTLQDGLALERKYAVFHFNPQGRLTADPCSTDGLYLAYLYCGHYKFDRAYEIMNQYIPQGKPEELIYLQWLCEKLSAKSPDNKQTEHGAIFIPDKHAIVTPTLLAIQLKALLLLGQLKRDPALKEGQSQETLDFLSDQRYVDFTIHIYHQYHRLSDHLSDDKKLSQYDLTMIATDIYLHIEAMKQEEQKKLNQLLQDKADLMQRIALQKDLLLERYNREDQRYTAQLETIDSKIEKQQNNIHSLVEKQLSGYLGLVHAKKPQLFQHVSEPTMQDFITQYTAEYSMHAIQTIWPNYIREAPDQSYEKYKICKVQDNLHDIVVEQEVIYISSSYEGNLSYAFLDESGRNITHSLYGIKDATINPIILKNHETLLPAELHTLRWFIISDAITSNLIEPGMTLQTIKTLMASPERQDGFKTACDQLSLNIDDDVLMLHLKYFVCLALEEEAGSLVERNRLRTFCIETIIACEDLNEDLKVNLYAVTDKRYYRLSIAIILLTALDYPKDFKASYQDVVKEYTKYSESTLKKRSLWSIVSDVTHGFAKRHKQPSTPIVSQAGVEVPRLHEIKKHLMQRARTKPLHVVDDSVLQTPHLKPYELPKALVSLSDILSQHHNEHQVLRKKEIQSFLKTNLNPNYDEVDKELDKLDQSYREKLLASIPETFDINGSMEAVQIMLAGLSIDIVDSSIKLKRNATFLPITLQNLLSMRVDQLSGKQAPINLDRLLLQYASGIDEGYLTSRYALPARVPMIRRTLNDFLRQVFLYRQYQHILKALADVHTTNDPLEQAEKTLYLAGRLLELAPLNASPALALFQHQTNKTVRHAQWAMIDRLTKAGDSSNRAEQLMMGEGKTKVILPEAIFLKANGIDLAIVLVPDALLHTTYQDLKYTAKTVYNQDIVLFQFDRNSPCDPVSLKRYLFDFEDVILQRKGLIMTPGSLQSLYLKQRELLYQAKDYQENSLKYSVVVEQLNILKDIVTLFKNNADVIADELHKVLDINIELNYSIGEKKSIEPEYIDIALRLFKFLASTPIDVKNEQDMLFILNGKSLSDFLADPSMLYHPEALIDRLIDYYESCYLKQHDVSRYSEKATNFLTAQWRIFLRATLKSKVDERYGRSLSEDVSIAIPYAGNNVPTTRLFENFVESMNYTIQMTYLKGVPFVVFKNMMCAWKSADQQTYFSPQSEAAERYQACLDELHIDERSKLPRELKMMDVANEAALRTFYVHFEHNKTFIDYALQENILPSITIYPHKLTSHAIHLTHLVHRIQGVSGTLGSHPTFAKSIRFNQASSFGVKNRIKDELKKKETKILTRGDKNDYHGMSALIDIGAHERGKSNQQVAMELAEHFQGSHIQYVLFFKEDHLAAWKVGGTDADIMMLPSTDAAVIEQYLRVKPDARFTYYAQTNATGTDILQAREARARVTVDMTTTLSDFLQAVMRMRQLFAGQTIDIVISKSLEKKLNDKPTLETLYEYLEKFERDKLADDVFKSACKQLLDVVQNDFERRLLDLADAKTRIRLFPHFQSLLMGENLMVLPDHYKEEQTKDILEHIKQNVVVTWTKAVHDSGGNMRDRRYETELSIETKCHDIIQHAMTFCRESQQTSLLLGTEVSIEQQQEAQVQVELKVEQQIVSQHEVLKARPPNLDWANRLSVDANGHLTGDDATHHRLAFIWKNSLRTTEMNDWSDRLWLSTDFYMIHDSQRIHTLPLDTLQKPILATLFWKLTNKDEVHAVVVSQEEADVLAKRLTATHLNSPSYQIWLETSKCHFVLTGVRPDNLIENVSYQMLKEQMSVLDGDVVWLAQKKEWVWFKPKHISILRQQIIKQKKEKDTTLLDALEKKMTGKLIKREEITEGNNHSLPSLTHKKKGGTPEIFSNNQSAVAGGGASSGDMTAPSPANAPVNKPLIQTPARLNVDTYYNTALQKAKLRIINSKKGANAGVQPVNTSPEKHVTAKPPVEAVQPEPSLPHNMNVDYRTALKECIKTFPKENLMRTYGEKILNLIDTLDKNMPPNMTHDELIETLQVTYNALTSLQQENDRDTLEKNAQACIRQGTKIVALSQANMPQGKQLGGLLLGIAGVLLIAISIAFAVSTHLFGTPIAIAGINLGASYIAASIGGVGLISGLIGIGFFVTQKPLEIQLQEALNHVAQESQKN